MVLINLMFLFVVGFHSWAAVKLWNRDPGLAFAAATGALQFLCIWLIAAAAWLLGADIRDYLWWLILALTASTMLRLWTTSRYQRGSRTPSAPEAERPGNR